MFQIDLVTAAPKDELFQACLKEHSINFEVLPPVGLGGFDVLRYVGTQDALEALIREQFDDDEDLYIDIKPATDLGRILLAALNVDELKALAIAYDSGSLSNVMYQTVYPVVAKAFPEEFSS